MTRARNSANLASHGNLFVDIANDRTGIGSVVPAQNLHVAGTAGFHADVTFTGDLYNTIWDRSDNSLKFADQAKAKFGSDSDIIIRHDPSMFGSVYNRYDHYSGNVWFVNRDTTNKYMYIRSDDIQLRDWTGNKAYIHCANSLDVKLFYNNSERFITTPYGTNTTGTAVNDGLVVAGVATVTTMNVTGVLTYDDVTSVDSVGLITARSGIVVKDDATFETANSNNIVFDKSDNSLKFGDSVAAKFGSGNNLTLFHSGSVGVLRNTQGNFKIEPVSGEKGLVVLPNAGVELYHNNNQKLVTTSSGAIVTGVLTATSFSGSGANLTDIIAGIATDAYGNTFGGHLAGNALTSGNEDNVIIGREAGEALNSGDDNVFIGAHAGEAATSLSQSVLIGYKAGSTGQTGSRNVIIGDMNFNSNNQDQLLSCTFVGYGAGSNQQDSYNEYNTFLGYGAGQSSGSDYNVCIGKDAGGRRSDKFGIFIGYHAGNPFGNYGDMSGQHNIMIGRQTGNASTSGADNTLVGSQCGMTLTTGSNNLVLGHDADVSGATVSNEITLGDANITKFRIPGLNYVNDAGKVLINRNAAILASSSSKLEVFNSTENLIFIANSTAAASQDAGIIFAPANNVYGGKIIVTSDEDFSSSANRTAHMAFYTRKDGTAAERLRIASDGKVGINETPTLAQFQVRSAQLGGTSGNTQEVLRLHSPDVTNTTSYRFTNYRVSNGTSHSSSELRFRRHVDVTDMGYFGLGDGYASIGYGTNERVRIKSDGKVGINATAPTSMLQVDYDEGNSQIGLRLRAYNASGSKTWQLSEINGNAGVFTIRNATNSINALSINATGSVLAGGLIAQDNADSSKLAVQGGGSNIGVLQVHAGGGENNNDLAGITFSHGVDNTTARAKGAIAFECDASGYGRGDLCFYVDGGSDNNQVAAADEKLRITKQGNLIFKDKDSGHVGGGFYSRTKTCSGNTTTSFMRFVLTHGALAGAIYATASNNARSIAKSYTYAVQYGDGNGVNLQSDSGDMGGTNFSVVCSTSANQHDFRVTVTGSHSIEVNLTVVVGCANQDITYTEL